MSLRRTLIEGSEFFETHVVSLATVPLYKLESRVYRRCFPIYICSFEEIVSEPATMGSIVTPAWLNSYLQCRRCSWCWFGSYR